MTTIYLIRHAQASFGQANYDQLSTTGQLQAKVLGQYLAHIFKQQPMVVTGSMHRHRETAQLALTQSFAETVAEQHAGWNEFDHTEILTNYAAAFGLTEQLQQTVAQANNAKQQLMQLFKAAVQHWMSGAEGVHYSETWTAFAQRVNGAMHDLLLKIQQQQARDVVVFSSGGVIATLLGQLLQLSPAKVFQLNTSLANVGISSLHLPTGASVWTEANVLSVNEHHYLKAASCFMAELSQSHAEHPLLTWV